MVITEMSMFPAGRYSDLTDSATQALKYLRDVGLAQTDEEKVEAETQRVTHRPRLRPSIRAEVLPLTARYLRLGTKDSTALHWPMSTGGRNPNPPCSGLHQLWPASDKTLHEAWSGSCHKPTHAAQQTKCTS
jgi:hypothetical protein